MISLYSSFHVIYQYHQGVKKQSLFNSVFFERLFSLICILYVLDKIVRIIRLYRIVDCDVVNMETILPEIICCCIRTDIACAGKRGEDFVSVVFRIIIIHTYQIYLVSTCRRDQRPSIVRRTVGNDGHNCGIQICVIDGIQLGCTVM